MSLSNIEIPLNTRNRPIQITVDKNVYSCKFENETTEYWNEHSDYVPSKNEIVVFSDYITTLIGQNIPGIKIGDGSTNVIDLPFANSSTGGEFIRALEEHEANDVVHTTQAEKDIWNGKADSQDIEDIVISQATQPTSSNNKIWLKPNGQDLVLAEISDLAEHEADAVVHTTQAEKDIWNDKADADDLANHEADTVVHTTQAEKDIWNGKADADDLANHEADTVVHTTQAEKDIWNGKADISVVANGLVITLPS